MVRVRLKKILRTHKACVDMHLCPLKKTHIEKSLLPPRTIKSKLWISRASRAFSPWDIQDYNPTTPKSQDHFYGFCVTGWFPFIDFCRCYRLQMPDTASFLTASVTEILLQAGNVRSSLLPALTRPHSALPVRVPSERSGNNGTLLYAALHGER